MNLYTHPDDAYQFGTDRNTPTVRKMILKQPNKEGLVKVYIEVSLYKNSDNSTTTRRISTNVWINPKNWKKNKEEVQNEPDSEYKNKEIDKIYNAVKSYINSKGIQSANQVYIEGLSLGSLREFFPSNSSNRKCLTDYIDDYIEIRKSQNTPHGTLKEFTSMKNRVIAFDTLKGKRTYTEEIDIVWSDDFEFFLRNNADNRGNKGYNEGTVEKTYTILITVLNHFFDRRKKNQIRLSDDFRLKGKNGFKRGKKSINDANPLNELQVRALEEFNFTEKHLKMTRDRFLWQCYTGLRYGDAFKITAANIENDWLNLKPNKTINHEVKASQPLNENAKAMLEKYDYDMTKLKIANQPYNRVLSEEIFPILKKNYPKLNFKEVYGSHCGRDTFISRCVQKKVDWNTILQWVGQSSFAIMKRYIAVTDEYQKTQMGIAFNKSNDNTKPTPKPRKSKKVLDASK